MKPLIGIVSKPMKTDYWKLNQIVDAVREALVDNGARVFAIVPQGDSLESQYEKYPWYENFDISNKSDYTGIVDLCDGILMQGGGVISNYEHLIINHCIEQDMPLLGVCCGMTNMAFATGGDVEYSRTDYMERKHRDPSLKYKHRVRIQKDSRLYEIIGKEEIRVNSLHGGRIVDPGIYRVSACSDDGLIEGMEYPGNRLNLGVQWHPEFLRKQDPDADRIFSYFVNFVARGK